MADPLGCFATARATGFRSLCGIALCVAVALALLTAAVARVTACSARDFACAPTMLGGPCTTDKRANHQWKCNDDETLCPECDGEGYIDGVLCDECNGAGVVDDDCSGGSGNDPDAASDRRSLDSATRHRQVMDRSYAEYDRSISQSWRR
jgi:hypothetical protein